MTSPKFRKPTVQFDGPCFCWSGDGHVQPQTFLINIDSSCLLAQIKVNEQVKSDVCGLGSNESETDFCGNLVQWNLPAW